MTRLTVLSDMAGDDAQSQAAQAARWNLATLDVKTVGGKNVADLTDAEADALAAALDAHGVGVEAFSTHLFKHNVSAGEAAFARELDALVRVLILARRLKPKRIRLIAAMIDDRDAVANSFAHVAAHHPWLMPLYAEAVDRIHASGFTTVIENESAGSLFVHPREIADFFDALGRRDRVALTWDVQNLWQLGTFPTLDVYRQLRPYIGYLHLKGGVAGEDGRTLRWRSTLDVASWPVLDIVRAAIADGVSPVICLNPSHGEASPDYPLADATARDLAFLRRELSSSIL